MTTFTLQTSYNQLGNALDPTWVLAQERSALRHLARVYGHVYQWNGFGLTAVLEEHITSQVVRFEIEPTLNDSQREFERAYLEAMFGAHCEAGGDKHENT